MKRLSKEDYRNAVGVLKRYNYNCINILNIRDDIISISTSRNDGMPKAPYSISDTVLNKLLQLEENSELQQSLIEYKVVIQALALVNEDSKYIFKELYKKNRNKWDIINSGISERTFFRRKKELILAIDKEIKKFGSKLAVFY